jgi:hypothetical protein
LVLPTTNPPPTAQTTANAQAMLAARNQPDMDAILRTRDLATPTFTHSLRPGAGVHGCYAARVSELDSLSAALRQAGQNLTSAAAGVRRVLDSVAAALEPEDRPAAASRRDATITRRSAAKSPATKRAATRPRKKATTSSTRKRTSSSSAATPQRTRGRRPSA